MTARPDLRLVPAACGLWILAAVGTTHGMRGVLIALALEMAMGLGAVVLLGRREARRAILAHLALLAIGASLLVPAVARLEATRDALSDAAGRGARVELEVTTLEDGQQQRDGPDWALGSSELMALTRPGPARAGRTGIDLQSRLRVLVRSPPRGEVAEQLRAVRAGERVRLVGRVRVDGTFVVVTAQEIRTVRPTAPWRAHLRERARVTTSSLPPDEAALLRGMTTGDTTGLSAEAEDAMRRAGISHLVAVSGANIALVLAAVLVPLQLAGVRRRPRILLAALVGIGYVVLVGPEPSVLRAATMALPILAARFAGVRAWPVAALAATVAVWSVASPQTSASIGFVLSALSTGAILVLAPPAARALEQLSGERIRGPAALVVAVPLVAQLACTPVLVLISPEVSVWAVPVNVAVAPLVGPGTVLGLAAVVLGPVLPEVAAALAALGAGAAHLVLILARTADALPGSRIAVPGGARGAMIAAGVLVLLVLATAARRHAATRWAVATVLVIALAPLLARQLPGPLGGGDDWRIAACAVGQGDAVVLRGSADTPDPAGRRIVLVDTGPEPEALTACLDALGVHRIDLLVLTHPHADHVGGSAALTGDRRPREQWTCPVPRSVPDAATASDDAPSSRPETHSGSSGGSGTVPDVPTRVVQRGTTTGLGDLGIEVLWPRSALDVEQVAARETSEPDEGGANDCSVVLSVVWGSDDLRYVGLGDLEPAAQSELAELGPGPADVVKVAHHGSRRQDPELYARLDPRLAIIEVGRENTFGHPAPSTLTMLEVLGTAEIRTDQDGTVEVEPIPRSRIATGPKTPGAVGRVRSIGVGR